MNYAELLTFIAPETLLALAAFGVLAVDLATLRGEPIAVRMCWGAWLAVLGCVAVCAGLWASYNFDWPVGPAVVAAACVLFACAHMVVWRRG